MYEYIIGKVVGIKEDYIVLDNNGIGYKIFTSKNSLLNLMVEEQITMYIYYNQRDDGVFLYGFITEEELNMFNMLLLVSRIGPKVGLSVLSTLTPNQIKLAILNKDHKTLSTVPGIGKKTAERVILELKDRVKKDDIKEETDLVQDMSKVETGIDALMSLGYTRGEIMETINKMDISKMETEDIIKGVLQNLSI